jgi:hypothetical protein
MILPGFATVRSVSQWTHKHVRTQYREGIGLGYSQKMYVCARVCWCFISLVEWRFLVYMFRNLSYVCMFFIVAFFQHPWNLKFRRINWPLLVKQLSIDVLYVPLMGKRQFLLRYVYLGLLFSTMFLINTLPLLVYAIRDYIWVCYF